MSTDTAPMTDEQLRQWSIENAIAAYGGEHFRNYREALYQEAQKLFEYVKRTGEFKQRDDYHAKELIDDTIRKERFVGIVSRLVMASDEQLAAIADQLKDVQPLVWNHERKEWSL